MDHLWLLHGFTYLVPYRYVPYSYKITMPHVNRI